MKNSGSTVESSDSPAGGAAGIVIPKPLTKARKRLEALDRKLRRKDRKTRQKQVLEMRAIGMTQRAIASAVGLHPSVVGDFLSRPENAAELEKLREALRVFTLNRLAKTVVPAWEMTEQAAVEKDTKGFDNAARGLHALEKIASSASGEGQRIQVQHSGHVQIDHREELRALIAVITRESP